MLFDNNCYEKIIFYIKENIAYLFEKKMDLLKENIDWNHIDYFKLEYKYTPLNYRIEIENERGLFTIAITDAEGAQNTLRRIEKFNNSLNEDNIKIALEILKRTLSENNFNLYVFKDDKVYKKSNNQLFRVKDVRNM